MICLKLFIYHMWNQISRGKGVKFKRQFLPLCEDVHGWHTFDCSLAKIASCNSILFKILFIQFARPNFRGKGEQAPPLAHMCGRLCLWWNTGSWHTFDCSLVKRYITYILLKTLFIHKTKPNFQGGASAPSCPYVRGTMALSVVFLCARQSEPRRSEAVARGGLRGMLPQKIFA